MDSSDDSAASKVVSSWLLVDIGINLTSEMYLGNDHHGRGDDDHTPDIDLVVARAAKVGVTGLLITGGNLEESKAAIQLAHKYHVPRKMQCMATVGCHPTRCSEFESDARGYLEALDALISEHSCRNGTNGVVRPSGSATWTTTACTFASQMCSRATLLSSLSWPRSTASRCSFTTATRTAILSGLFESTAATSLRVSCTASQEP